MKSYHYFFVLILLIFSVLFSSCKTTQQNTGIQLVNSSENHSSNPYKIYSEKLGVKLIGNEDKKLIECLTEWIGVPYKYGGNTKQGTDCSGMVLSVYKEAYNINMYRSSADQLKNVKQIEKSELKAGDLVFFKITGEKVSHVGIYLGENKFIHASTKRGVVVNSLDEDYYKKYYFTSGRVIGVPYN